MAVRKKSAKKVSAKKASVAKAKSLQRRWKIGQEYRLEGTGTRRLTLVGRGKINDREVLMFHPVREAKKTKP